MTESPRKNLDKYLAKAQSYGESQRLSMPNGRGSAQGIQIKNSHLANEAILVNTLTLASLGLLGPHFLYVLQNHVAVSVKGLNASQ